MGAVLISVQYEMYIFLQREREREKRACEGETEREQCSVSLTHAPSWNKHVLGVIA